MFWPITIGSFLLFLAWCSAHGAPCPAIIESGGSAPPCPMESAPLLVVDIIQLSLSGTGNMIWQQAPAKLYKSKWLKVAKCVAHERTVTDSLTLYSQWTVVGWYKPCTCHTIHAMRCQHQRTDQFLMVKSIPLIESSYKTCNSNYFAPIKQQFVVYSLYSALSRPPKALEEKLHNVHTIKRPSQKKC